MKLFNYICVQKRVSSCWWQILISIFMSLFVSQTCLAAEELIYEETIAVDQETWSGGDLSWSHTVPQEILDEATRVEAIIGASDVDYPECSTDCPTCPPTDCEHDRLYVNGSTIALLSGSNDALYANPVSIPLGIFTSGTNEYRVTNEVVSHDWWVKVTESTLKFYKNNSGPIGTGDGETYEEEIELSTLLTLQKKQGKSTLLPGQQQTYTIILNNIGEAVISNLVVTDRLDPLLDFISTESTLPHSSENDLHSWRLDKLNPGEKVEIRIQTKVTEEAMADLAISNTAQVIASKLEEPIVSNTVTALSSFTPVNADELQVTKRLTRREGRIGRILGYKVFIRNKSNGTVFNLVLEDILPQGFTYVSGTSVLNGQRYDDPRGSRRLRWEFGALQAGERKEMSYQVIIGSNVRRGQNTNYAEASGVDGGGNKVNGDDQAIVMIGGGDVEVPAEIEATVFLDLNKNGVRNADEETLENISVILSIGEKRLSDKDGNALFEDLLSGHYAIAVDPRSLPDHMSVSGEATKLIRLLEGERAKMKLPVEKDIGPARLTGMVYIDRNGNNTYDKGEEVTSSAKTAIDKKLQTQTKNGRYTFSKLMSGKHRLEAKLNHQISAREIELEVGNNEIDIPLPHGGMTLSVEEL